MLDGWHYTRDELKEEEQAILDAALTTIALNLINHALHDRRVVARMNAKLIARKLWVRLKSHCFARIICHNVLEHFILSEQTTILAVALQP